MPCSGLWHQSLFCRVVAVVLRLRRGDWGDRALGSRATFLRPFHNISRRGSCEAKVVIFEVGYQAGRRWVRKRQAALSSSPLTNGSESAISALSGRPCTQRMHAAPERFIERCTARPQSAAPRPMSSVFGIIAPAFGFTQKRPSAHVPLWLSGMLMPGQVPFGGRPSARIVFVRGNSAGFRRYFAPHYLRSPKLSATAGALRRSMGPFVFGGQCADMHENRRSAITSMMSARSIRAGRTPEIVTRVGRHGIWEARVG